MRNETQHFEALHDHAIRRVHHQTRAVQVVGNDPIGHPVLEQIARHVALVGIDEAADDLVAAIQGRRLG